MHKKKSSPSVKKISMASDCQAWGDRRQFFVNRPCGQPFLPIGRANRLYQGVGIETGHNQQTGGGPSRLGEDRYRSVLPHTPSWPFLTDEKQNEASALLLTAKRPAGRAASRGEGQEIPTTGWSRRKRKISLQTVKRMRLRFRLPPRSNSKSGHQVRERESPRYRSFPKSAAASPPPGNSNRSDRGQTNGKYPLPVPLIPGQKTNTVPGEEGKTTQGPVQRTRAAQRHKARGTSRPKSAAQKGVTGIGIQQKGEKLFQQQGKSPDGQTNEPDENGRHPVPAQPFPCIPVLHIVCLSFCGNPRLYAVSMSARIGF